MSMSSSSGSTWSEADPWSEQSKYLSSTASGGKNQALFDSAYDMWQNVAKDPVVSTLKVDRYGNAIKDEEGQMQYDIDRPRVFGESESAQNKLGMDGGNWAMYENQGGDRSGLVYDARQGNLEDQYVSTVADFMSPQTSAQDKTLGLSDDMYSRYTNADGTANNSTGLGYLLPQSFEQVYRIMAGQNKISTPTANAATVGSYSNMSPATVGAYNNMSAANVANINQNISREVGDVAKQMQYNSSFDFDNPLNSLASGAYVGGNPYIDDMYNSARDKLYKEYNETLLPQWDTQAEALGRDDSNVWAGGRADLQGNYLDSLGDLSSSLYGNAYEGDMNRMLQGLSLGSQQSQFEDTMTQDINRYNTDIQNRKKFEEAGYDYGADSLLANLQSNQFLQNAANAQEASRLTSDQSLQKALTNAGYDQEENRLTSEQSLQKALTSAGFQQEANTGTQRLVFDAELQNLANRMAMAQYAPDLAMRAYDPIQQEAGVGDIQQQQAQSELDAAVRQGEFLESIPTNMLGTYANMISGNYGGTQMTESESGK